MPDITLVLSAEDATTEIVRCMQRAAELTLLVVGAETAAERFLDDARDAIAWAVELADR